MSGINEQLQRTLSDQQRELEELRRARRQTAERLTEMDAQEIEIMVGIVRTKAVMDEVTGEINDGREAIA